jgi:spore coat protein H
VAQEPRKSTYAEQRDVTQPGCRAGQMSTALVLAGVAVVLVAVLVAARSLPQPRWRTATPVTTSDSELFDLARVWTVHLTFTADQWDAMEPSGGVGPFGGPPGGPGATGRPNGPGGFGGFGPGPGGFGGPGPEADPFGGGDGPGGGFGGPAPPGGPGAFGGPPGMPGAGGFPDPDAFGPGMFIAPVFLKQGDANEDQRLTADELVALGRRWFDAWDVEHTGALDADSIRDGLNVTMAPPPGFGMPPGGMGPPGGPAQPMAAPKMSFRGPEGKRNGVVAVMGMEFPSVRADLDFAGHLLPNVSVRYKGNGTFLQSRASLKRSLKVDLNKEVRGRKFSGVAKLNFHNNVTDASWMNEVLSYRLFRDAGVPAPRTAYAQVYVTVPGKYDRQLLGLYSLVENIDNSFAKDRFGTKKGAIFKPVATDMFEDMGDAWSDYQQAYDPKTTVSNEETRRLIDFCKLVSYADDAEFADKVTEYLDLEEFAKFMAVTAWLSTCDSLLAMSQNYVVYLHPRTHRFQFIPWDLDHSFGQFYPIGTQEQRENLSIDKPWAGKNRFLERVFAVDAFKRRYLAEMRELDATLCRPERFIAQVDELAKVLRPCVEEESADLLARFDQVTAGEPAGPAGFGGGFGGPRAGGPMAGPPGGGPGFFGAPVKPIKGFVVARAKSIGDQLAGRATGATLNGFGGPGGPPSDTAESEAPKMPSGFGPGMFLAPVFMTELDQNKDGAVSRDECDNCFRRWFAAWNTDQSDALTEPQVRKGLNKALSPFRDGPR